MSDDKRKNLFGDDVFNVFKDMKLPEIDLKGMMPNLEGQLEVMKSIQRTNIETARELMDLQKHYFQELARQWNELARATMSQASVAEKTEISEKMMKDSAEKVKEHVQDFNAILKKSNDKIMADLKDAFTKDKK